MNKFQKNLTASNSEIKAARAKAIAESAAAEQRSIILELEGELRKLNNQKMDLEDLSPDSELSLRPARGDFDAVTWVRKMQNIKVAILNKEIELQVATETENEYFLETKTNGKAG